MDSRFFRRYIDVLNENAGPVNDDWFKSGSFQTYKKPAVEKYEIAQRPGTIETLEGPVGYDKGHYIMTGPKGENILSVLKSLTH